MRVAIEAFLAAMACVWVVFCVGGQVVPWVLVGGGVLTVLVQQRSRKQASVPAHASAPAPAWAWIVAVLVACVVIGLVGYGALATPARQWDGVVAWELRANVLAAEPHVAQPFFADPAVYSHSRDYPLLQPVLMAALQRLPGFESGRVLFPVLFALLLALVANTLRRRSVPDIAMLGATGGLAVTPALIGVGGGAVDSGYAELLLTLCMTTIGAGVLLGDRMLLMVGTMLAIGTKPEGLAYAALPVLVGWLASDRAILRPALEGWCLGALLWLPLQLSLQHHEPGRWLPNLPWVLAMVLAVALLVMGSHLFFRRWRIGNGMRWVLVFVMGPLLVSVLPVLLHLAGRDSGTMQVYFVDLSGTFGRLLHLPVIVWGLCEHAFLRMHFGATFVLPLFVLRARRLDGWRRRDGMLALMIVFGLALSVVPFVLSDNPDLAGHLRSRMPRLLLQWTGPAWLLSGVAVGQFLRSKAATPSPAA